MSAFFGGEELTISIINCNSLNMSASAKWNQTLKICSITKLKTDIIFLSDVRLSNKNLVSAGDDIKKSFLNNPYEKYDAYFNSTQNKRGVGILIKSKVQYDILEEIKSDCENILLLRIKIRSSEVTLICIYGPNTNDPAFFTNLSNYLQTYNIIPVVIGGDWNCTFSCEAGTGNIDCLNMARPPNLAGKSQIYAKTTTCPICTGISIQIILTSHINRVQ
jgi:exonuclease III